MAEYIEREALLKSIREKSNPGGCTHITPKDVYSTALQIVECEPAANVAEVRHGKWSISEYEYLDCSECGHMHYTGMDSIRQAEQNLLDGEVPNYCPNCGAKMDGGEPK